MLSALGTSILFLASYLFYHYHAGTTRFTATGWVRPLYFFILLTHTVLAVVIVPLVIQRSTERSAPISRDIGGSRV